jgi:hypothetical protein
MFSVESLTFSCANSCEVVSNFVKVRAGLRVFDFRKCVKGASEMQGWVTFVIPYYRPKLLDRY